MIDWIWVTGLTLGIEYIEDEELGFILVVNLGFLRFIWYKDLIEEDE